MHYVYEWLDPHTKQPVYVGITNNLVKRMTHHMRMEDRNENKKAWLKQILAEGLEPEVHILAESEDRKTIERLEREYIQNYHASGIKLLNHKHIPNYKPRTVPQNGYSKEDRKKLSKLWRREKPRQAKQ